MPLGPVIDVALGLTLTFTLMAVITTALQEIIATALNLRGKQLRDRITSMLAGGGTSGGAYELAEKVLGHPLLASASGRSPSYAAARNISAALFDELSKGSQAPMLTSLQNSIAALPEDSPVRQNLTVFLNQTGSDLDQLTAKVERWYDDTMDRASGDYKRFSGRFALAIGFAAAISLNVDAVQLTRSLWADVALRSEVAAVAANYAAHQAEGKIAAMPADSAVGTLENKSADSSAQFVDALKRLQELPIGWPESDTSVPEKIWDRLTASTSAALSAIFGWLLTALAVSLGAPFWFDTLQKLANLRGTGPKPERSGASAGP